MHGVGITNVQPDTPEGLPLSILFMVVGLRSTVRTDSYRLTLFGVPTRGGKDSDVLSLIPL